MKKKDKLKGDMGTSIHVETAGPARRGKEPRGHETSSGDRKWLASKNTDNTAGWLHQHNAKPVRAWRTRHVGNDVGKVFHPMVYSMMRVVLNGVIER